MAKKKRILFLLLGTALLCLLLWRFVPRNIYTVADVPEGDIRQASVHVMANTFGSGGPDMRTYSVSTEDLDEKMLAELLDILEGTGFRPDFRNLLPWKTPSLQASGQPVTVSVLLIWGQAPGGASRLNMLKPEELGVSARFAPWGGFDVYHPADRELLSKLHAFAVKYGEEKD